MTFLLDVLLSDFQEMLGMQRRLGITLECNFRYPFFCELWLNKAEEKAAGINKGIVVHYYARKQFI